MIKTNAGWFFEDYAVGDLIIYVVLCMISGGECVFYHVLYSVRYVLHSSDLFVQFCGLSFSLLDDLVMFHIVFGKTVFDVLLNVVANLGYAEGCWIVLLWFGDMVIAIFEVIGIKENSNGTLGVVWVCTMGCNQFGVDVLSYVCWVMVCKRGSGLVLWVVVLELAFFVAVSDLVIFAGLDFSCYDFVLAGELHCLCDYVVGEVIDYVDGVMIEEAEYMLATRLWQNTAKVYFDVTNRVDGKRLIYGGYVMLLVWALSFNGLANVQMIVVLNGGVHANSCFVGDMLWAWFEVLDLAEIVAFGVGVIWLWLVVITGVAGVLCGVDGKYDVHVLLDLDYWVLLPV